MDLRREFELPAEDIQFLEKYGCPWETISDKTLWVLLHAFRTQHPGYNHSCVTAAVRIETGYPNAALDMVYFYPALARLDGKTIKATQVKQRIRDLEFQRWSRHYTPQNPYIIGEHNLETHILTVEDWLSREFQT